MDKFKLGDRVRKHREYSKDCYCLYGGNDYEVPLMTCGEISRASGCKDKYSIAFDNGINWSVHGTEIELEVYDWDK